MDINILNLYYTNLSEFPYSIILYCSEYAFIVFKYIESHVEPDPVLSLVLTFPLIYNFMFVVKYLKSSPNFLRNELDLTNYIDTLTQFYEIYSDYNYPVGEFYECSLKIFRRLKKLFVVAEKTSK
ncbi:hypothetical protein HZS_908, partial [Henneguya salminicola]